MRVNLHTGPAPEEYLDLIAEAPLAMPTHAPAYHRLMAGLTGAEPLYFLAGDRHGRTLGALPCLALDHPEYGPVLNSLPFFGSVGGVVRIGEDTDPAPALVEAMLAHCREIGSPAATAIPSPLDGGRLPEAEHGSRLLHDERIGQITPLPAGAEDAGEKLFAAYEGSARRNVRKAFNSGVECRISDDPADLERVQAIHRENMAAIGGLAKPDGFPAAVARHLEPGRDCRLYLAHRDGELAAGLLVLSHGRVAEYFMPCVAAEHRSAQPLSPLIHRAMTDAALEGRAYWNWGGTWTSQTGVYRFKRKWGARDMPYAYSTWLLERTEPLLHLAPQEIQRAYPWFFVVPFNQLAQNKG
ncbi:GNAT family N-acetyltransferase [Desulfohalovibrio reitneri]|uniref:GNAT family N-acetyltransferase n=1 Tax=Desulfohalovibrio reitneri TaxID=1307759 RepID=UPI0004A6BDAE|nr:GNAT family N-acetyltransferase [Desulfohalovibrio reitneri]